MVITAKNSTVFVLLFTNLWNKECTWIGDVKEVLQTSWKCILYTLHYNISNIQTTTGVQKLLSIVVGKYTLKNLVSPAQAYISVQIVKNPITLAPSYI